MHCKVLFIVYKRKNHFFKMKGDIGMGWSSKKERTRSSFSAKPHKTTLHHPYIFVVDSDANKGQRYRDGVM